MQNFSIGTDSELFVVDNNDNIKSAINIVHGTKEKKLDLGGGHYAFYDNILAEVNLAPAKSKKEWLDNIKDCYQRYATIISPYKLKVQASAIVPKEELTHPDALAFGCSASYNALTVSQTPPVNCAPGSRLRTGGGHIHMGGNDFLMGDWERIWIIRMLDLFLSIPSVYMDWDETSVARREIYGSVSDHRPQPWGVEYRSISNFWLIGPSFAEVVYDICDFALDVCINNQHEKIFDLFKGKNEKADKLCEAIIKGDRKLAKPFMDICKRLMPKSLYSNIKELVDVNPGSFYENWKIKA